MNVVVISYSLTGNNEALAKSIAEKFAVKHIKITEPKPRTMGTIVLDVVFNKTPKVQLPPETLINYDLAEVGWKMKDVMFKGKEQLE